jgi:selenoprotein W-related protein
MTRGRVAARREFCVPCGFLPAAEVTAYAVLERAGQQVSGAWLAPSHGGVFKVRADGEPIFERAYDGCDVDEVVTRVGRRLGAGH